MNLWAWGKAAAIAGFVVAAAFFVVFLVLSVLNVAFVIAAVFLFMVWFIKEFIDDWG